MMPAHLAALIGLSIAPVPAAAGDPVRLQLKWHHQFQFAGYYAAQAKGYYTSEGLDATILEGGPDRPPIATVLRGGDALRRSGRRPRGMLVREGIDPARVQILPQSWDLADLVEGRIDAMSAYEAVEPALLRARGVEPALLRSIDYGVDFYGDTLFTTEAQVRRQPKRVAAFLRASLRGRIHALEHPEEIASLIANMDAVAKRGLDHPSTCC